MRRFLILFVLLILGIPSVSSSQSRFSFKELNILSGRGTASIDNGPYQFIPLYFDLCFEMKPVERVLGGGKKTFIEGVIEPVVSYVTGPYDNVEFGVSFLAQVKRELTPRFSLFGIGGVGIIYTTQHTHEEGSQYLFTPQVGCGAQIALAGRISLIFEYRFRHMSNAGLESPNRGINTHQGLVGISISY